MISQEKLSRPEEVGMIFKGLPGEGNGNPLQYSCLENPTDREAWQVTVHGVTRVRHDLTTIGRKIQRAKGKKEKKKKNTLKPRISHLVKLSFKREGEIKVFHLNKS